MIAANLGLFFTMLVWGSQIPVLDALLERFDPYFLSALRYVLALPVFLVLLRIAERRPALPSGIGAMRLWLLGAGMAGFAVLYTVGIAWSNPVTAAMIAACGPVVAYAVAWTWNRTSLSRRTLAALGLAVVGGVLATGDFSGSGVRFGFGGGEILIVAASVCWSWYSLAAQDWLRGRSQLRITTVTMIPGAALLALSYAGFRLAGDAPPPPAPMGAEWVMLAWVIFPAVVGGTFLWNFGVLKVGVVVASMFLNLIPAVAVLTALGFGITPRFEELLGGAIVLAAVMLAQPRSKRS